MLLTRLARLLVVGCFCAFDDMAASDLQAAIDTAIQHGLLSLTIAGGTYRFAPNISLQIHNATDLTMIVPEPVHLIFSGHAGVSFVGATRVSIGNISIDYDPRPTKPYASITYALVNSSEVLTSDLTINSAPYMAITAFTGGGNHTFRRLQFVPQAPGTLVSMRDAIHFSDVRVGPTIEDSSVGWCGDDFLNIKNTLMLLLRCDSATSCIVINPHVAGEQPIPFGGRSVLATVQPGDGFSFYAWPSQDMLMPLLSSSGTVAGLEEITTPASSLLAQASALETSLEGVWPWTAWTNQTMPFGAHELWRVNFSTPLPATVWLRQAPASATLINIDDISCAGSRVRSTNFTQTSSQLGRFKSPRGDITGCRFDGHSAYNLEFSALPQWLEGPIKLDGIAIEDNIFVDRGPSASSQRLPLHCGPLCEAECTRSGEQHKCMQVSDTSPCTGCPNCSLATPWASVRARNNTVVVAPSLRVGASALRYGDAGAML